jgi:hypothetical protein
VTIVDDFATTAPEEDVPSFVAAAMADPDLHPDGADGAQSAETPLAPLPALRTGLVVGCAVAAAGVMAGGLFAGWQGRIAPTFAGACGVAVAAQANRRRRPLSANATIALGIVLTTVVVLLPAGLDNLFRLGSILSEARQASRVLRPPAEFLAGWRVIVGFVMATIGFLAAWVALELRRPAIGLLLPLPALALGAISLPDDEKLAAGLVSAVLFIVGLALLSSLQNLIDGAESAPGIAFELRRTARAIPLLVAIVGVLLLLARSDFLFPDPRYDPTRDSVAPKATPLSQVEDRVLFTVASTSTGPWRIGILDVYDAERKEWRLPAFAESSLRPVPPSGVVEPGITAAISAEFTVADLGGAVLPGLPNTTGVIARGPRLSYDHRTGSIRVTRGQIRPGLRYGVAAAALPTEDDLRGVAPSEPTDEIVRRALDIPAPPPAVRALLDEAPTSNSWDRMDHLRRTLLTTVVSSGAGTPTPVGPEQVEDMLVGSKEANPFEIVAAQAMLARWAGVPARIGYGYDGGEEQAGGVREIRPKHGLAWLEVHFEGFGWLPVLGQPTKAKASLNPESQTKTDPSVTASDEISVQVFFPLRAPAPSPLYEYVRRLVVVTVPVALFLGLAYLLWPIPWKAWLASRRRAAAAARGPRAEVAQAYAELRDYCTDLGLRGRTRSPLGFLGVLADDDEHVELAWLVTRTVWGDLRHEEPSDVVVGDALELVRSLRRRLGEANPPAMRFIAKISRLSLRHPYAPELDLDRQDTDVLV